MGFQSTSIENLVKGILKDEYVLPAIQRHFVWSEEQIVTLFDSIMRGYPVGSFLFWKVDANRVNDYQYYKFIQHFSAINPYNEKFDTNRGINDSITAVLDGQQRITSLLIGLAGTYKSKRKYVKRSATNAYQTKKLYLNLLSGSEQDEEKNLFEFRFLDNDSTELLSSTKIWYPVDKILRDDYIAFIQYPEGTSFEPKENIRVMTNLNKLKLKISGENLSYYLETEQDLEKVLNIFIRVNSGGTPLSYSDLLLSTATALWREKDIRSELEEIIQYCQATYNFKISSDLIMKSCLMLADLDVKFSIKNFNKSNMQIIERQWEDIKKSLILTFNFLSKYGFNSSNLTSYNAILPIAYFIKINNIPDNFIDSINWKKDRKNIASWIRRALLMQSFGANGDTTISGYRNLIREHCKNSTHFPFEEILLKYKDLNFTENVIEEILEDTDYGGRAFCLLSEIFSDNYDTKPEVDHIFPRSKFKNDNVLEAAGFTTEEQKTNIKYLVNNIANLQLLPASDNKSKNDMELADWITTLDEESRSAQLIPPMDSYEIKDFEEFCKARTALLKKRLCKKFGIPLSQE